MPGLGKNAVKLVIRGTIQAVQTWSCGLWVDTGIGTAVTQAGLDAYLGECAALVATWWTNLAALNASSTLLVGVDAYHYTTPATHADLQSTMNLAATIPGTGSGNLPGLLAQVASLRSATPGRSGRGRIYIPVTSDVYENNGQLSAALTTAIPTQTAQLIAGINAVVPGFDALSGLVAVASFTRGDLYPIVRVQTGSVSEVQRRRVDQEQDIHNVSVAVS